MGKSKYTKALNARVTEEFDREVSEILEELNEHVGDFGSTWSKADLLRVMLRLGAEMIRPRHGVAHDERRLKEGGQLLATCPDVNEFYWTSGPDEETVLRDVADEIYHKRFRTQGETEGDVTERVFIGPAYAVHLGDLISNNGPTEYVPLNFHRVLEDALGEFTKDDQHPLRKATEAVKADLHEKVAKAVDLWCDEQGYPRKVHSSFGECDTVHIRVTGYKEDNSGPIWEVVRRKAFEGPDDD